MQVVRYRPSRALEKIETDLDNFWESGLGLLSAAAESSPLDMYEEGDVLTIKVTLPNFNKEDIKASIDNGVLEIAAEHSESEEEETNRRYYFHESSNDYFRRIPLPTSAAGDMAEASFDSGVLTIRMPSTEKQVAKQIKVN